MAISQHGHRLLDLVLLLNRCSLGLYFLLAGIGKIRSGVGIFSLERRSR